MADQTVTTTNIQGYPTETIKNYSESAMGRAAELAGNNYKSYADWARERGLSGDQVQAFTKLQKKSFGEAEDLGQDKYSQSAAQGLEGLAQKAGNLNYAPSQFGNQFQAPSAYQPSQFNYQQANAPQLQNYQMGPAQQVNTQSFAQPGSADAYMSPYMQNVVDVQKREAQRQSGMQGTQQQAQAAQAGAFGGGRDAIMRAERERNLGQQMGDIQATGSQAAYQQAQQQFNAEQQARLQAQQANQQAGLTVGGQNLSANLGVQQFGAGQNMQSQLANQQAGMTTQQQQEQAKQYGYGQGMNAASLNAQYGLAGQQEAERSRQFGSNYGLQGMQAGMQGYGALGSQGQNLYGQTTGNINLRNAMGTQQQQQGQNMIDVNQQNFAAEQNYPYKQLGFFSDVVNRQPVGNLGQVTTQPGPSLISQTLGAATAYYGAKKAAGGAIRSNRGAGLVDLALSGM
jgi:hypothetical protein